MIEGPLRAPSSPPETPAPTKRRPRAASAASRRSGPVKKAPSSNGYKAGFSANLMLKDLRLAQSAALLAGTSTPAGAMAAAIFGMHIANGKGHEDTSSIIKMIKPDIK